MNKRARIIKTIIVALFVLGILFPLFIPADTSVYSEPAFAGADAAQTTVTTAAIAQTQDQDFVIEKIILLTSLIGVVGIAFLSWGISNRHAENKSPIQNSPKNQ